MKAGDRVKVDFISESRAIYSGKRFTGYGVLDRVEDGRVFGRLDDGTPFMCLCADVEVVGMSDFITDVEQQYEVYCEIAEEHGFIDLNAKKNGFRCTTKSNEFNAGWIAFVGAVAAVRDEQQAKIEKLEIELSTTKQVLGNVIDMEVAKVDNLKAQLNNMEACYVEKKKQVEDQYKKVDGLQKENAALVHVIKSRDIQLENEKHEYDELVNKLVDSKMKNTKLQKLINEALEDLEYPVAPWDETIGSVVKVLRGEE